MKGITMISIAHRMETIENSDVIFMLEDGKVVESGKYNEMMERKAHFQKFVEGNKYRTIDQIAEKMLHKLIMKLLGIKQ
jgi:ABC-type multidrug transport system fused ATPase/permease subunit